MLRTISHGKRHLVGPHWYPARGLHLVDIENLVGVAAPSLSEVRKTRCCYLGCAAVGPTDQIVLASSHATLLNAALGWPHARYRARSGPDGADLELLDVLWYENVAARFTHVTIGSGDGIFAAAAATLAGAGVFVTVVSRRCSLSPQLALAAHELIFFDGSMTAAGVHPSPAEAA